MKLLFHSNTAATVATAAVVLPALASGYNMGVGGMFGRPIYIATPNTGRCVSPPFSAFKQQGNCVDDAFEKLESELNENGFSPGTFRRGGGPRRRRRFSDVDIDKKTVEAMRKQQEQQQELFNKALDLANDVVNGIARDVSGVASSTKDNESLKQQQKMWFNRAFGIASDVASGRSSPRYDINNNDEKFQIALDVPGVKPSAIDIRLVDDERSGNDSNDKILIIEGQRESSIDGTVPVKFKKEFFIDASVVDVESIAAQINNGVLVVTATKILPSKKEPMQKKIPVMQVSSDDDQGPVSLVTDVDSVEEANVGSSDNKTVEMHSKTDEEEKEEAS